MAATISSARWASTSTQQPRKPLLSLAPQAASSLSFPSFAWERTKYEALLRCYETPGFLEDFASAIKHNVHYRTL